MWPFLHGGLKRLSHLLSILSRHCLQEDTIGRIIWESFQLPTDTFLPNMKISANARTSKKVELTSFKSPSDPSVESFSTGINPVGLPQSYIWKDCSPCWCSSPWNTRIFIGIPNIASTFQDAFSLINDKEETYYLSFSYGNYTLPP